MTPLERLLSKVEVDLNGCWIWQAHVMPGGYGQFAMAKRDIWLAHRASYTLIVGDIPDGLHIDHLCSVRNCVNPDHLEPVSQKENNRRTGQKLECPYGHPYTRANIKINNKGDITCRTCENRRTRENYHARKASER